MRAPASCHHDEYESIVMRGNDNVLTSALLTRFTIYTLSPLTPTHARSQIKFLVDGQWRLAQDWPRTPGDALTANNTIYVE